MSLMVDFPVDTLEKTIDCNRKRSPRSTKTVRRRVLQDDWEQAIFCKEGRIVKADETLVASEISDDSLFKIPLLWELAYETGDDCFGFSLDMASRKGESSSNHDIEEDFEQAVDTFMRETRFTIDSSTSRNIVGSRSSVPKETSRSGANVIPSITKGSRNLLSAPSKQKARRKSKTFDELNISSSVTEATPKQESRESDKYIPLRSLTSLPAKLKPEENVGEEELRDQLTDDFANEGYEVAEEFFRIADPQLNEDTRLQKRRMSSNSEASTGSQKKRTKTLSSRFRGVSKCTKDGRWQARIRIGSVVKYLGRFRDEIEAAHCYDAAAHKYHGARAMPNFDADGVCLIDKREAENKKTRANDSGDEKEYTQSS